MNEKELTTRLKEQDMEALDYLIEHYSKLILGVTASVLVQSHEREYIDEVYNDVIMILWYKIGSFQIKKGTLKNWIISIAKFKALDYKRKMSKRLNEQSIEEIATQLDLSTTAVYARLSRGRIKLKKIMEGYHE